MERERGNFPGASAEQEQALQLYANSRGGLQAAFGFANLAMIETKAGLFAKSTEALSNADARLAKLEGSLTQLRAAILAVRAEAAYAQRQWTQAARFARLADGRLLSGLAAIRMGNIDAGLSDASASIQEYDQKESQFTAAAGEAGAGRSTLGKQPQGRRAAAGPKHLSASSSQSKTGKQSGDAAGSWKIPKPLKLSTAAVKRWAPKCSNPIANARFSKNYCCDVTEN